jgi:hypothetical protein
MSDAPNTVDRVETAANIYVQLSLESDQRPGDVDGALTFEIPVSELDLTKEVDIERVRETGLYPDGYAINAIDIDGSISFAGHVVRVPGETDTYDLDSLLFHGDTGTPKVFNISVVHETTDVQGESPDTNVDTIENCIINSSEYSASSGDSTESSYEFMGQRMNSSGSSEEEQSN